LTRVAYQAGMLTLVPCQEITAPGPTPSAGQCLLLRVGAAMPPLVSCDQCRKEVAPDAETCPHCGTELPTKRFRSGTPYVCCEKCSATNHYHEGGGAEAKCRACGASLLEPFKRQDAVVASKRVMWGMAIDGLALGGLIGMAFGGGAGAVQGGVLGGCVTGWIGLVRHIVLCLWHKGVMWD
jgi:hypothetical protein